MSKLETLLLDGLKSELILKHQLRSLRESLKQQLQEADRRQREELERRIHHNDLLLTEVDQQFSDKNERICQTKQIGLRRSTSALALTTDNGTSNPPRLVKSPNSSAPAGMSSKIWKHCPERTSRMPPTRTQKCERADICKTTQLRKEEEAEAECRKKFSSLPVPSHVSLPLYQEIMELKEKERKQGHERRKNFLLSVQKPFSFQEREEEKKEKLNASLNQVSQDKNNNTATQKKSPHKGVKETGQVASRKVHIKTKPHENLTASVRSKPRIADRTKMEKLGFLEEKPSFQPKIIHQVPDFRKLHRALQTEALRRTQSKDVTKSQPFYLRTSARPARQSKLSPENSQVPGVSTLRRSKSFGALTSLSTDTLPIFITDDVRRRCMAIRMSMEMRDSKNQESADWLKKYQMRSQAMKKKVSLHAKLLDPHNSLREEYNEKVQRHREADQQRMKEYMRELRDMKARVDKRPYLFEQVKQRIAKVEAEQVYRNKLRKAGVKEQFVEEIEGAFGGTSTLFRSEDESDVIAHNTENGSYAEEGNVDDGEKIEDVEGKSVKCEGEEMP